MTLPGTVPKPRRAVYRRLIEPLRNEGEDKSEEIDRIIALYFKAPRSFTGEDVVELHVHGSLSVINATLAALDCLQFGMASPGEFTQRSFEHGKMDLSAVEGLADLINAETTQQRKQAIWHMDGNAEKIYNEWTNTLTTALAKVEAIIDFGDDEDIDQQVLTQAKLLVASLIDTITMHLTAGNRGEMIRSGIQVAIIGPPNSGKSSLLNLVAQRPAAIVSPIQGTTRDVVEVSVDIAGYPIKLCDTAGLNHATNDPIEQEGIRRSIERFKHAHFKVIVVDATSTASVPIDPSTLALLHDPVHGLHHDTAHRFLFLFNKIDKMEGHTQTAKDQLVGFLQQHFGVSVQARFISCVTSEGFDEFITDMSHVIQSVVVSSTDDHPTNVVVTRARHRGHLTKTLVALQSFLENEAVLDLAAENLRQAIDEIGKITGRVDSEDILDIVFRDFCIGK